MTQRAPVKYIITEQILLNDPDGNCRVAEAGSEISYSGLPSANMLPTCEEGEKRRKEAIEYDKKGRFENQASVENVGLLERQAAEAAIKKAEAKAAARKSGKKAEEELA